MIVWRITGSSIGHDDCGAAHFPTKAEADVALREYLALCRERGRKDLAASARGPEKLTITTREQLAEALDAAMGFGGS